MDTHPSLPPELWERTPPAIRAYIETLEGQVQTLTSMVHTFQEQVRTLEERLNQTSRNSSRPPSSDSPQHQRPRRPPGKRRRGGQPGHPGHTRPLVPVEEVDEVVVLKPKQCSSCHAPLSGDDASPFRHQVIEIPPIKPVITEYQWHQLTCPACGETTRAPRIGKSNGIFAPVSAGAHPRNPPPGRRSASVSRYLRLHGGSLAWSGSTSHSGCGAYHCALPA